MQSKPMMARRSDYQVFGFDQFGGVINIGQRMADKLLAIPLPDLKGKSVLDVGCDHGFWSFLAANLGAKNVLGLDRGRPVCGEYFDVVESNREVAAHYPIFENVKFEKINLGREWRSFEKYDVIFMFSMYHHFYESSGGDHLSIWFWLWNHCAENGHVLWENPVDCTDSVVQANVSEENKKNYTVEKIIGAARNYFDFEYIGPARHEKTRRVYKFTPKKIDRIDYMATLEDGAGGARKAFEYMGGRRIGEIKGAMGFSPVAVSLNLRLDGNFDFERNYYRAKILDVVDRSQGLESKWSDRWCRFYPVVIGGVPSYAMRFEGETYPSQFVEIISRDYLRPLINSHRSILEVGHG